MRTENRVVWRRSKKQSCWDQKLIDSKGRGNCKCEMKISWREKNIGNWKEEAEQHSFWE